MRLAGIRGGSRAGRGLITLLCGPAAASSGCREMITPFSSLTSEPLRPRAAASADPGGRVGPGKRSRYEKNEA